MYPPTDALPDVSRGPLYWFQWPQWHRHNMPCYNEFGLPRRPSRIALRLEASPAQSLPDRTCNRPDNHSSSWKRRTSWGIIRGYPTTRFTPISVPIVGLAMCWDITRRNGRIGTIHLHTKRAPHHHSPAPILTAPSNVSGAQHIRLIHAEFCHKQPRVLWPVPHSTTSVLRSNGVDLAHNSLPLRG